MVTKQADKVYGKMADKVCNEVERPQPVHLSCLFQPFMDQGQQGITFLSRFSGHNYRESVANNTRYASDMCYVTILHPQGCLSLRAADFLHHFV